MAINFPISLDTLTDPTGTDTMDSIPHSTQHSDANNILEALEAKVGVDGSAVTTSLDYKTSRQTTKGDLSVHDGTKLARLPVGTDGYMLVADSTQTLGVKYTAPTAGGTVTTASVVSTNGFSGTVANPSTAPAITLTTSVTGMLKGNGTAMSAGVEGTDYYKPGGTDVSVSDGGTGKSSLTAYAPIFGGTTSTGAVQSGTVGTSGQLLTSNGAGALPTFQTYSVPVVYEGTYTVATATSNGGGVIASTHYQTNDLTIGVCVLTRGTSGYAKLLYSPDNSTWTTIENVSTTGTNTFTFFMKKSYYYYVEVDSPAGGVASTASLTFRL